jgi:hypothetical protein
MDQRREARIASNQSAWITIYGKVDTRIPGRIRNVSGRGIGVEVAETVGTGSALKIEVADSMLLGEAIYCRSEGKRFYVGVELDQAVHSLMALGTSVRAFSTGDVDASSRTEQADAMHDADR